MGNLIIIIGVVFAVLQAALKGYITAETAGIILVASVFLVAFGRSMFVKLVALSIPIYFFAKEYGFVKPVDFMTLILTLLPLFIMLFGFYIMFRGLFKKSRK
jgi:hypothetical protein